MNYDAAVKYLLSLGRELAAPTQAAAAKFDLENITVLAERLGQPQRAYPSAHIAGTNGKGSTGAFLESILRAAGLRTGLNTSPHLEKINERIRINGIEISDAQFADVLTRIRSTIEVLLAEGKLRAHPTYFECVTAMAFQHFSQEHIDFGVFEVGLGGRLDATNILQPKICIITRIDFDHENFLGHSLREIAGEKAGILKAGVPVVVAEQLPEARDVIFAKADELGCPIISASDAYTIRRESSDADGRVHADIADNSSDWSTSVEIPLSGRFQLQNALNAVAAARLLSTQGFPISDDAIRNGVAATQWPGRLEKLQSHPDVYLDGAHNPSAARELATFWKENLPGRRIILIYAALRDKAIDEVAGLLFPHAAEVILTEPRTSRAISATQLAEIVGHHAALSSIHPDGEAAFQHALAIAQPSDAIFVTGSLYLVGQLRHYWKQRSQVAAK
ncbi:MAG TPA: folylpolyglutamate synthase/dihydrofolate synthase family protein [Candidatus Acidoferrum sp.]|jgi:dihydrofolate synthase/folylpolyglutamate synthase